MKILDITRNDFGQIIAEVLNCGKVIKVAVTNKADLPKAINKACYFTNPEQVRTDLALNFEEFA